MEVIKSVILILLTVTLIFSAIEPIFAPEFNGYLTVEFNQTTAHVGDTITIIVTACNQGNTTWHPLEIYAPIPNGLQYLSHIVPNRTIQDYDPSIGIWDVNRMSCYPPGNFKQLFITAKVLPEAEGKSLSATAKFQEIAIEETGNDITAEATPARLDTLTVVNYLVPIAYFTTNTTSGLAPLTVQFTDVSTGNVTGWLWNFGDGKTSTSQNPIHTYIVAGNYTVSLTVTNFEGKNTIAKIITVNSKQSNGNQGNGNNGTGNGNTGIGNLRNTKLVNAIENFATSEKNNPLQNLRKGGGGGNGKAYEVSTNPSQTQNQWSIPLAVMIIAGLIIAGILYESRHKR